MKRALLAAALAGALGLAAVASVSAHHSFAATYFEDQTTKIEGDLVQFQFRNPHSYVHLEAADAKGVVQRWAIEWGSGMQLSTQGLTATTLKVGDHVDRHGRAGTRSGRSSPADAQHRTAQGWFQVEWHVPIAATPARLGHCE